MYVCVVPHVMYERWDVKGLLQSAFLSHTQLFPGLCSQCTTPSCLHPQFRFADDPPIHLSICELTQTAQSERLHVCFCVYV